MDKEVSFVLGCQRSGTTLLSLVLNAHPQIQGIDEEDVIGIVEGPTDPEEEIDFSFGNEVFVDINEKINSYLTDPEVSSRVAIQMPAYTANLPYIKQFLPTVKVLWCLRDPRDVVASMIRLHIPIGKTVSVSWAAHPGSTFEILNSVPLLDETVQGALGEYVEQVFAIFQKSPCERTLAEVILTGALAWRVKNELLTVYKREAIPFYIVKYEQLLGAPRQELETILNYVGVPWHDNVLSHHQFREGIRSGGSDASRPLDQNNTGKWRGFFADEELALIREVTEPLASELGYDLQA